ncbi:lithostathine isoform X2 [Bos mutus]|uniref:lithostathine isoform X2 n=1 Tax=Bos mutus TaxID=72004 RepID=UPI0038B4C56F
MLPSLGLPRLSWMLLSCLMLLSQVQGEDSQRSERISCPRGSIAYGSSCYVLYKVARSWMNANGSEPDAGGWEWSSTAMFNYFAWERIPSTVSGLDHCGILSRTSGYLKWKNYNCNVNLPYICKFKG